MASHVFFFAGCSQTPPCADESTVPKATPELGVIPEKNQTGGVEDIKVAGENMWNFRAVIKKWNLQGCSRKNCGISIGPGIYLI